MNISLRKLANYFVHFLGNKNPTDEQLALIHSLLTSDSLIIKLLKSENFTEQEIACLFFASRGIDIYKSAEILRISKNTVKEYRQSIIKKTNCKTITHAIFTVMLL